MYTDKTYDRNAAENSRLYASGEYDSAEYERRIAVERQKLRKYCESCTFCAEDAERLYQTCINW